jgi:hypothetical protein
MSEVPVGFSDSELESALVDLGQYLSYSPAPDLSGSVRAYLEKQPRRSFQALLLRRAVLLPALTALVILASVLAFSPNARSAVASWFHLAGVQIESGRLAPGPLGHNLALGERVTLGDAQNRLAFPILMPRLPGLGRPDEIYVGMGSFQSSVSLVYRARHGLPRAATTGVGLLITEFHRRFFDAKLLPIGTNLEQVTIGKGFGLWLTGAPHTVYYVDVHGKLLRDTIRLAGDVLVWQHGTVTMRLEGKISRQRAIEIARSMEAGS